MAETSTKKRTDGGVVAQPARRRFTVDEYHRMAEAGILRPDERVELLDGEIYEMAAMGNRHAARLSFLNRWFMRRLDNRALVRIQTPVRLSSGAEPEPDLALVLPRADDYEHAHPSPADVLLIIEIADTSLAHDRDFKLPRYAEAGIPEVWIVDLTSNRVLIYRDPTATGYRTAITAERGDALSPLAFAELSLPVNDLLP